MTLFDLLIVAGILVLAYRGWLAGLETAGVAALELLACLAVAVMLHEVVAGWLHAGFAYALGDVVGQAWSILLAFGLLAWGSFALIRAVWHQRPAEEADEPVTDIDPLADRIGGALAGGVGGVVFIGGVLVTLSMVPFLAGFKPSGDRMLLDVGKTVLRAGGQFATEHHEGRALPLWGEPASRATNLAAKLTSEPWFDADDDRTFTAPDRFRDVDGNGTFTKDLYYEDVDGDSLRRIGLIDKYVAGRWDGGLISNDRPRPEPKKPEPPRPAPKKPAPAGRPGTKPAAKASDAAKPGQSAPAAGKAATGKKSTDPKTGTEPAEEEEPPADKQADDDF